MLCRMTRTSLRRTLSSILGLVFAASMSLSTVQATEMAAKMTMASAIGVADSDSRCPDCNHGSSDMKAMDCRVAVCGGPGVATLTPALVVVVRTDGLDLPIRALPSLVGWTHAPDPYPPRLHTLG